MNLKEDSYSAARLVVKALQSNLSPVNDIEYRQLLAMLRSSAEFRELFQNIVRGLELQLLDWSERGVVIVPSGPKSPFSFRLSNIRSSLSDEEKSALVLIFVGIAAAFFPTTECLDNEDYHPPPVKLSEIRDFVYSLACNLKSGKELDETFETVRPGWDYLASLPLSNPQSEEQRAGLGTLVSLSKLGLKNLREAGLIRLDYSAGDELEHAYTATYRFRIQLREFSLHKLVDYACKFRLETNEGRFP